MGEAGSDLLAGLGVVGVAEEVAGVVVDQGVAALEHAEGAEGGEAGFGDLGAAAAGGEMVSGSAFEAVFEGFEVAAVVLQMEAGVLASEASFGGLEAASRAAMAGLEGSFSTEAELIELLGAAVEEGFEAGQGDGSDHAGESLLSP